MASRDGNGWIHCALGHRHWGKFGAAGLLAYAGDPGDVRVLLQHRVGWSHHGGTWGLPGGAADSHETPVEAALREAAEECGVPSDAVAVRGIYDDDHGGWAYRTVIARTDAPFAAFAASEETDDVEWVAEESVAELDLHPGLAAHWGALREALEPLTIIVDAANVIGSRPDGWWRDRVGAARRLVTGLTALAQEGVTDVPAGLRLPVPAHWLPDLVVVLEGQARGADPGRGDGRAGAGAGRAGAGASGAGAGAEAGGAGRGGAAGGGAAGGGGRGGAAGGAGADGRGRDGGRRLRVVSAPGSGDDTIAGLAAELPGRRLVVTADRELRSRCENAGALVTGPRWLTGLLDSQG